MNINKLEARFGADFSEFEKKIIEATKTGQAFGREMIAVGKSFTAALTVPLTAAGAAAVKASEAIDDACDRIRIGTGKMGEDLDRTIGVFKDVMGQVPESAQAVSEAVTELNKRTGAAGSELGAMATQALELARISGGEVKPIIEATQKAFSSWGVETKNQGTALDFLFKVSQSTGVGVSDLSQLMAGSGATLRALGVDFEHGAVLLGQFQKAGVDGGTVMAGLTKAATAFAKEGKSMREGLGEVLGKIKDAPDATKAAQIATEYFGKSSIAMADAVRKGSLSVDDMVAKLKASPESIHKVAEDTAGLAEAWGTLQNKITLALEPLGAAITRTLIDVINAAAAFVDRAIKPMIAAFGALPQSVQTAVVVFGMVVAAIGPALVAFGGIVVGLAKVSTAVLSLKATAGPALTAMAALFPSAGAAMTAAWASVTAAFAGGTGILTTLVSGIAAAGAAVLEFAGGPITLAVAALVLLATKWDWLRGQLVATGNLIQNALAAVWSGIKSAASTAWSGIKAFVVAAGNGVADAAAAVFGPLWEKIKQGFNTMGAFAKSAWDSLKSGASSAGSWVIEKLKATGSSVGSILGDIWTTVSAWLNRIDQAITGAGAKAAQVGNSGRSLMEFDGSVNQAIRDAASPGAAPTGAPTISTPGLVSGGSIAPGGGLLVGGAAAGGGTGPKSGANVDAARPWNQSGTREFVDPYNLPATQGPARTGSSGGGAGAPYTPYTFNDPYLAAGQKSISDYNAAGNAILQQFYGNTGVNAGAGKIIPQFGRIPAFADGGIITQPTIGLVGEAGPEAIIPLNRARGMMGGPPVVHVHVHVSGSVATQRDLAEQVRDELVRNKQRNVTNGVG